MSLGVDLISTGKDDVSVRWRCIVFSLFLPIALAVFMRTVIGRKFRDVSRRMERYG